MQALFLTAGSTILEPKQLCWLHDCGSAPLWLHDHGTDHGHSVFHVPQNSIFAKFMFRVPGHPSVCPLIVIVEHAPLLWLHDCGCSMFHEIPFCCTKKESHSCSTFWGVHPHVHQSRLWNPHLCDSTILEPTPLLWLHDHGISPLWLFELFHDHVNGIMEPQRHTMHNMLSQQQ